MGKEDGGAVRGAQLVRQPVGAPGAPARSFNFNSAYLHPRDHATTATIGFPELPLSSRGRSGIKACWFSSGVASSFPMPLYPPAQLLVWWEPAGCVAWSPPHPPSLSLSLVLSVRRVKSAQVKTCSGSKWVLCSDRGIQPRHRHGVRRSRPRPPPRRA
jgi:hypothetical protein